MGVLYRLVALGYGMADGIIYIILLYRLTTQAGKARQG